MITVRPATPLDIPWLLEQLQQFDIFFGSTRSLFPTIEAADQKLRWLIAEHPFLVADDDEGSVGFIAGILGPHPWNEAITVLSEAFWWVAPIARGGRAGSQLLRAFIAMGKTQADWIIMTLEAESPVDPQSLIALGFRPKETSFLLEVA